MKVQNHFSVNYWPSSTRLKTFTKSYVVGQCEARKLFFMLTAAAFRSFHHVTRTFVVRNYAWRKEALDISLLCRCNYVMYALNDYHKNEIVCFLI